MFERLILAVGSFLILDVTQALAAKTQNFDSGASAAASGWVADGSGVDGQTAGFTSTNFAGGTAGEARFDVTRGAELSYLDTNLGMTISGDGGFTMSGKLNYIGATGVPDLGFNPSMGFSSSPSDYLGLTFRGDEADLGSGLAWGLRFENSGDGIRINSGGDFSRIMAPGVPRTFSLVYEPNSGANGTITASVSGAGNPIVHALSATNRGLLNDAAFTRFGMLHRGTSVDAGHGQELRFDDATRTQGDADGDQDVDGGDFLAWQRQLGVVPTAAAAAFVPEPTAMLLVWLCLIAVVSLRIGRRCDANATPRRSAFAC